MAPAFAKPSSFAKGFGGQVGGHVRAVPFFSLLIGPNNRQPMSTVRSEIGPIPHRQKILLFCDCFLSTPKNVRTGNLISDQASTIARQARSRG
jgi:hypothetical protein